ncbi:MAG: MG2 domain-containing protein, partial [Acidobacteriota bacterium]
MKHRDSLVRVTQGHVLGVLLLLGGVMHCATPTQADGPTVVTRPATAQGTVIVPDDVLRRWDPVTVFFDREIGPATGGPEATPERHVTVEPTHPGAFTWLDARTLQFQPADPWPALTRYRWRAGNASATLVTLMAAPTATLPTDEARGLEPVDAITLTFAEPIDPDALARAVTIEIRPLPGIGGTRDTRWLGARDFEIKTLDRAQRDAPASYVLALAEPIPLGRRAIVHFRLALDDAPRSFTRVSFRTDEPFRATALGCPSNRFPVTTTGSRYPDTQAIRCEGDVAVSVDFSAALATVDPLVGRNLVRLTPAVDNLSWTTDGYRLDIRGDFARDVVYEVTLATADLRDRRGRRLELDQPSSVHVYFPAQPPYLAWQASGGLVERSGPQTVPITGRGTERVDLRLHRINPRDRSFWPFPDRPLLADEDRRPPGPGEVPDPYTEAARAISPDELRAQLGRLGSPPFSDLIELPLRRDGDAKTFGLDLSQALDRVSGEDATGHYLLGLRRLDAGSERAWMRLQVTDLALTTLEEPRRVKLAVTSLSRGTPVADATVTVAGYNRRQERWATVFTGRTDATGLVTYQPDNASSAIEIRRIEVTKGNDVLILDARRPPDVYRDGAWLEDNRGWLQWTQGGVANRGPQAVSLAHLFTERPVYRPEEAVHIRGFLRTRDRGELIPISGAVTLVIDGPGDVIWRQPLTADRHGAIYHRFEEAEVPTGSYNVWIERETRSGSESFGRVQFRKEAYRLPRFEIDLARPEYATLDAPFNVDLTATYYAGGRVAGRPLAWRVTQFPYTWQAPEREGFMWSSDGRFSRTERFEASPTLERDVVTDDSGGARLV